jgi:hypothetical protein
MATTGTLRAAALSQAPFAARAGNHDLGRLHDSYRIISSPEASVTSQHPR